MYPRPVFISFICALTAALSACGGGSSSSGGGGSGAKNNRPTIELSSEPVSATGRTGELVKLTAIGEDADLDDSLSITWEIEPDSIPLNNPGSGPSVIVINGDASGDAKDENTLTAVRRFHMPETASEQTITVTATVTDPSGESSSVTQTFTAQPTPASTSAYAFTSTRTEGWENIPAGKLVEVLTPLANDGQTRLGSIDNVGTYFVPNADNSGYFWINTGFYKGDHLLTISDGVGGEINQVFTSNNGASAAPFQLLELSGNLLAAKTLLGQATPPADYQDLVNKLVALTTAPAIPPNVATNIAANLLTLANEPASIKSHHINAMLASNFPVTLELVTIPACGGIVPKLNKIEEILTTYADLERYADAIAAIAPIFSADPNLAIKRVVIRSTIGGLVIKHLSSATLGLMNGCEKLSVSAIDPDTDDFTPLMAGDLMLTSGVAENLFAYGLSGIPQDINDAVIALNAVLAEHSTFNYSQIPEDVVPVDSVVTAINVEVSGGAEASCSANLVDDQLGLTCTYTGSGAPQDAAPFDLTFTDPNGGFSAFVLENVQFNP